MDPWSRAYWFLSIQNGPVAEIETQLNEGINVNLRENTTGQTALMIASIRGRRDIVKILLGVNGIDVNLRDDDGWTALTHASRYGFVEIVQVLLAADGIDVNVQDVHNRNTTALMMASVFGHTETVLVLAFGVLGIDVNCQDNRGMTALMLASYTGHTEIVKILLQVNGVNGIDVNLQDRNGRTALGYAYQNVHIDIIELLEAKAEGAV